MTGDIASEAIEKNKDDIIALSLKMWENPEGACREYQASAWASELLEKSGFTVSRGIGGLKTAFKAVWGSGSPVIGFLGELDALPGLGQKVSTSKEPAASQENGNDYGQGCGHNLIMAGHAAAAIGMKAEMEKRKLGGTVICYGTPAEETLVGKPFMARAGAFDDLDAAFGFHPMFNNEVSLGNLMAINSVKFHFTGITSHAASDPQNGRSAQDAVELMNIGANYLREHVTGDVRIHYAITETGAVPNIVPDKATVWYFVRSASRQTLTDVFARVQDISKGAALMTGTSVEEEFLGGCYETMQNRVLAEMVHKNMVLIPQGEYTPEEIAFARELNAHNPELTAQQRRRARAGDSEEIQQTVPPIGNAINYGSTDVGDVAHIVPALFFTTACSNVGAPGHSWQVTASAGHSIGQKGMLYAGKVMAKTALDLLENPDLLAAAKAEFAEQMAGRSYVCPIPEGLEPPAH